MYKRFGLTLTVTQACNLRCRYCYIATQNRHMAKEVAEKAIMRSVNSIEKGGLLELGFFGGEPFLVSQKIVSLINFSKEETKKHSINLIISITTNGTIINNDVWSIIKEPKVNISISIDGRPQTHNHNRCFLNGEGSYDIVQRNIRSLLDQDVKFRVVTVVSPETVENLDEEIEYLHQLGCHHIELSLDVWSSWGSKSIRHLKDSISRCAQLWVNGLPHYTLSWFDDKAAQLSESTNKHIACGFGKGDITITPSGHLYPCERLIGNDSPNNPMRFQGDIFEGEDFCFGSYCDLRTAEECIGCSIRDVCNTTCGCCNYARTGEIGHPDGLLCLFNQWCLSETKSAIEKVLISS